MVLRPVALALVATALLLAPATQAHTPAFSADGKVRASIGLLNEPVSTNAVTGLDVCFTHNAGASPGSALANVHASNFSATLTAPDGSKHRAALETQDDRLGCLTFVDPLALTLAGQYLVDLSGTVNGTTFDVQASKAGDVVIDRDDVTFPDSTTPSNEDLQQRIQALEVQLAALQTTVAMKADVETDQFAPGAPAALLLVVLAAFVALRRRA